MIVLTTAQSVTLAAFVTLVFLPLAIVMGKRSAAFAWMTVAMLGMMWRGEAWKAVYLATEQELQLRQPQSLPSLQSSSKTAFHVPRLAFGASGPTIPGGASPHLDCSGGAQVPRLIPEPALVLSSPGLPSDLQLSNPQEARLDDIASARLLDHRSDLALWRLCENTGCRPSPDSRAGAAYNFNTETQPTPCYFI